MGALRSVAGVIPAEGPKENQSLTYSLSTRWLLRALRRPTGRHREGASLSQRAHRTQTPPFRTTLWRLNHQREGRLLPGPSESPEEGPARPHPWPRRLPEILPAQGGCPFHTAPAFSQPKVGALKVPCALMGTGVGTRAYSQVEYLRKRMPWGAKGWGEKKTWEEIART